jgi:sulfite oxidase
MTLTRRNLFLAAAAGVLSRGEMPSQMIVRSSKPQDLEMPLDGFFPWITPVDKFFIRTHAYTPTIDLAEWKLQVDGQVGQPLTLTLDELKKMPRAELVSVLECAGNGRSFYQPRIPGAQWAYGAVGNGRWAGVRLGDVLKKAGLKDGAKELLFDGADAPLGTMPDFQRTIPVAKAIHADTLLAYEMNGKPLSIEHGYPLRLIAPGWAGDSWVKWLQHITVLDKEFDGFWMKTAYRHPPKPVAPGTAVDPAQMVPVTDLNVKSVIAAPVNWAKPGPVKVRGAAWSNSSPVTKVEVSVDFGKTWQNAHLGSEHTQYSWRLWELNWKAAEGKYVLLARATNAAGETQPMDQPWNPSGYLWNTVQRADLVVSKQNPPQPPPPQPEASPSYPDGYRAACLGCHDEMPMRQQRITRTQWDREIDKMVRWGSPLKPDQRPGVLDYLAGRF